MRTTGIVLIIIGALMMIYTGFNYVTEKKVLDVGPIEVNKEQNHPVRWSPLVGGVLLVAGLIAVVSNKKKMI